jgi:phage terminase large subunit-like protein
VGTPGRFRIASTSPKAERFFRFAEKLKHYKGEWADTPITLQPYQKFRLGSIFGWVHVETGLRRFRHAFNLLPRKQGKSLEAAIVSLYVTFYDGEPGAEGYCAATKRDQAKLVFNDAKKLVQSSGLKSRIAVQVSNLHRDDTASKLEPLGADCDSTDGLNPNFVNIDEYQAHKTRGLIDVLETATRRASAAAASSRSGPPAMIRSVRAATNTTTRARSSKTCSSTSLLRVHRARRRG